MSASNTSSSGKVEWPLFRSPNKLKLGTFATNVSYGTSISAACTMSTVSWGETLRLARRCDEIGFEMVVPLGRWKGLGGAINFNGDCFETLTWAAGIAQATEKVTVFATVHVPTLHPIVAAKQATTVDHIAGGRFALNLVMGWFPPELAMFGADKQEHDQRYQLGDEWVTVVKRLWTEDAPFDFDGKFFQIKGAESFPKPLQAPHPPIMNAGSSGAGADFAARQADFTFVVFGSVEGAQKVVETMKSRAREYSREISAFSSAHVICRDTEEEVEAAYQEVVAKGDHEGAFNAAKALGINSGSFEEMFKSGDALNRVIVGLGAVPLRGSPERVAAQLKAYYDVGVEGWVMSFVDYGRDLEHFNDKVIPLLRKAGLRA